MTFLPTGPRNPKNIEKDLEAFIKKYNLDKELSVRKVKEWVYNADKDTMIGSNIYQSSWMKVVNRSKKFLAGTKDNEDLLMERYNEAMTVFTQAWNNFPHKALGNKSPTDLVEENSKKMPKPDPQEDFAGPQVFFGDQTMEWEEYLAMLELMEKMQKPFKKWIDKKALPAYEKYLQKSFASEQTIKKHSHIASIFTDRVLHVGFIEYEEIRPDFIIFEFPDWWQTHVIIPGLLDLKEITILNSLCIFINFIEEKFNYVIPGFWERLDEVCE